MPASQERLQVYKPDIENYFEQIAIGYSPNSFEAQGIGPQDLMAICHQISAEIEEYNRDHPGEMLPKTAVELWDQAINSNSVIIAGRRGNEWQYLHHCTTYELLSTYQQRALGGWNVVEFGTAITHAPFRAGYRLGQQGAASLREQIREMWGDRTVVIATIKQFLTGSMFGKAGARAISWSDHPYLAFLTDSCEDSSPTYTGTACLHRRPLEVSTASHLDSATNQRGGKMACTLIAFNADKARAFDDHARYLHGQRDGLSMPVGLNDRQMPQAWGQMAEFFNSLETQRR